MKTLDRYLLRELALTTVLTVAVLSGVLVFGNLLRRVFDLILNHDIPLGYVGTFATCLLPFCLIFTLPWGFVTAVLLVYGRMSGDNEITAWRMNGVSLLRVGTPALLGALLLTAFGVLLNATLVPHARAKMERTLRELAARFPTALVAGDSVIDSFPGSRIYVGGKTGTTLTNIHLFKLNDLSEPTRVVSAKAGEIVTDSATHRLSLRLSGARIEDWPSPFDPEKIHETMRVARGETSMPLGRSDLQTQNPLTFQTMTLMRIWRSRDRWPGGEQSAIYEINRRLSLSLACFTLVLVALPLAVWTQRREPVIGFGLSVLVGFSYFFLFSAADACQDRTAVHPEILVWIPNAFFLIAGTVLLRRVQRR